MPPGARPNFLPRATPRAGSKAKIETLEADRDNALKRIGILEALVPDNGCCPGDWIVPELLNGWESYYGPTSDADCVFKYRWGPYDHDDPAATVDNAGIEFSGQITGGTSGTVVMDFPAEDTFECDKDFIVLVIDGTTPTGAWANISSTTGEMTVTWPLA